MCIFPIDNQIDHIRRYGQLISSMISLQATSTQSKLSGDMHQTGGEPMLQQDMNNMRNEMIGN